MQIKLSHNPQSLKRHRSTRSGHIYDPSKKDKENTASEMLYYLGRNRPKSPLDYSIGVSMMFSFTRPKKHYRTGKFSHLLTAIAPQEMMSKPDIDTCAMFYLDSLVLAGLIKDDNLVVSLQCFKDWKKIGSVYIEVVRGTEGKNL